MRPATASIAACLLAFLCVLPALAAAPAEDGGWTTADPSSIPLPVRLKWSRAGNLAPNPSFEEVRPDNPGGSPAGWETTGPQVEWVDRREPPGSPDEVAEGDRAVRIRRARAGEADPAEGVLSDFIPVIPGNYDFAYDVRLEGVTTPRPRLGARMEDAVTVRLLFFDRDRTQFDGVDVNPVTGTRIDPGDKSYTFGNHWSVDRFPWATVRARTYHYPYSEGDIPDRARFVRIFIGLRSAGTMWVDRVEFRLSKWNFTALERLEPWIGRALDPHDRLIPTPREVRPVRPIPLGGMPEPAWVVLPDAPAPAERAAADLLLEALNRDGAPGARAALAPPRAPIATLRERRLVFSVGRTRIAADLPPNPIAAPLADPEQGYFIRTADRGGCHMVQLSASTSLGVYYAAATAAQLVDQDAGIYHSAEVSDHPDFRVRAYRLAAWSSLADLDRELNGLGAMSRLKLNLAYAEQRGPDWHRPGRLHRVGVEEVGAWCRRTGVMALGAMVNPYSHLGFMANEATLSEAERSAWTHADQANREKLKNTFGFALEAGATAIMLLADDHVPHEGPNRFNYGLYAAADRRRFLNLQNAQAAVIKDLRDWVRRRYPGTRLEFCPPWYANEFIDRSQGKAEMYYRELTAQIPADVAIVWTGPGVRSLWLDAADLHRFREATGRAPLFWDNTLYARNIETAVYGGYATYYPGKVRMCNLFEPLDVERPHGFAALTHDRRLYVNGSTDSELYRIKYATVADWAWNAEAYVPERSLWKALVRAYGAAAAAEALAFNDAYYGLMQVCMRAERGEIASEAAATGGREWRERAERSLDAIRGLLPPGHRLPLELAAHLGRQTARLEQAVARFGG